jgi:hypothetical protein
MSAATGVTTKAEISRPLCPLRGDVEAEHHAALVVLGDVAVAIHRPGLVTSSRMSTVSPVRTRTVSFQTRFGSTTSSRRQDEEAAGAVDVEGVRHRVI